MIKIIASLLLLLPGALKGVDCSCLTADVGVGYDYFRSLPEGDWPGNTGAFASGNLAFPVPCKDLGFQLGGSYGLYDWSGRGSAPEGRESGPQQQLFLTAAFFRAASDSSGWNGGVAYDWMWNKRFGTLGAQTSFAQLRGQGGYTYCRSNEFGLWGTIDLGRSHRIIEGLDVQFRAISQINAFWRHLFENGVETIVWAGLPYKRSLAYTSGRAGKFLAGGSFSAPLCSRLTLHGHANYMVPHSSVGGFKERNYAANFCFELKYAFGAPRTVFAPYMPVANNSNFIADTNILF